jgi:hypothetical protein
MIWYYRILSHWMDQGLETCSSTCPTGLTMWPSDGLPRPAVLKFGHPYYLTLISSAVVHSKWSANTSWLITLVFDPLQDWQDCCLFSSADGRPTRVAVLSVQSWQEYLSITIPFSISTLCHLLPRYICLKYNASSFAQRTVLYDILTMLSETEKGLLRP